MAIPKILHRVWLGGAAMPEEFVRYGETWKAHHPDWEHRLWTEDSLPSDLRRREILERFRMPAERSDLLRYELVWRYGGVYVDTDMECLRPIDELAEGVDFFAAEHKKGRQINNQPIGATPGHPILEAAVRDAASVEYEHPGEEPAQYRGNGTGPGFWGRHVRQFADAHIVPAELFHPGTAEQRERAYAEHHHANSWMSVEKRLVVVQRVLSTTRRAEENLLARLRKAEAREQKHLAWLREAEAREEKLQARLGAWLREAEAREEKLQARLGKAEAREEKLVARLQKAEARLEEAREELAVLGARRRARRAAPRRPLSAGALSRILARVRRSAG